MNNSIEFDVKPDWDEIEKVRNESADFLQSHELSDDTIHSLSMIIRSAYEHLSKLDKTIQWIRGYQDPFEAYIERIKEVSKKPLNDMESGIGLVRIAYEGNALIDFFVAENNMLNVSVVSNLEREDRVSS